MEGGYHLALFSNRLCCNILTRVTIHKPTGAWGCLAALFPLDARKPRVHLYLCDTMQTWQIFVFSAVVNCIDSQLDGISNDPGDRPVGMSVREYLVGLIKVG